MDKDGIKVEEGKWYLVRHKKGTHMVARQVKGDWMCDLEGIQRSPITSYTIIDKIE